MKTISYLLVLLPLLAHTQTDKSNSDYQRSDGINFIKASWQEVLKRAKTENKFVFVDCYASWCLPCKKMEKEIFTQKLVGDFINKNFISVRVQMDTTKLDDEYKKQWYLEAHELRQRYKITVFPSYLFFSPEGKIVHRARFTLSDSNFVKLANNALNPSKQYYSLLDRYNRHDLDYSKLSSFATIAKNIGEENLANKIAGEYLHSYINELAVDKLMEKKYFEFASNFPAMVSSKDKVFKLMYDKGKAIDEMMQQKGFSQANVIAIITKEEINPKLWPDKKSVSVSPDWDALYSVIQEKYDKYYAGLILVDAQYKWYTQKKDWSQLIKVKVKQVDTYGLDTAALGWVFVNNFVWDYVVMYCTNKDTLNKVAGWMEIIIKGHPEDCVCVDTYANLLFKAGRITEAILWEEKAIKLDEMAAKRENRVPDKSYRETLNKMKRGIPTWVLNNE